MLDKSNSGNWESKDEARQPCGYQLSSWAVIVGGTPNPTQAQRMEPFSLKGFGCSLFGEHLPEFEDARTHPLIVIDCVESLTRIQLIAIQMLIEDLIMIGQVLFAALGSRHISPCDADRSRLGQQHSAPPGPPR